MLTFQHNILAMNASRQFKTSNTKMKKTTEKLSSGYKINRGADDAAGLAISEKMRRQIRGLTQGTANAHDGVSYVQTADGAMEEVHAMLQRMNELTIQSLNGTLTDSDRAALNAELDQLRTEIDRISRETEFNTQPVFEEHEASFYQIAGSRRWNDDQMHVIAKMSNDLSIHLPAYYQPSEYTFSVPAGTYTTQELIDEIEDALSGMSPANPGFVFEFTDKGFCNLNFENISGEPVEIDFVDGALSYLLYDHSEGNSSTSLLGTTVFDTQEPLIITSGQNDELGFYVESPNGSNFITMQIPPGKYTRAQMIDQINGHLAQVPGIKGVTAKEYGTSSIQITGGDASTSITGLKGNMFKLETVKPIYSSVFYDNVKYGNSSGGTCASISGNAYYNSSTTTTIDISAANHNNVLRFKANGAADYTEITLPDNNYTFSSLASEINRQCKAKGIAVEASVSYAYSPYYAYYLTLSSTTGGSGSSLEFDTSSDSLYANTYASLFLNTYYKPVTSTGQNAYLNGQANLSGAITLANDASLLFHVDNQAYTINNLGGTYASRNDLISKLNDCLQNDPSLSPVKDKIQFVSSGNTININALTKEIHQIHFTASDKNDTYKELFTGTSTTVRPAGYTYTPGSVEHPQGSTQVVKTNATASFTLPSDKRTSPITIGGDSNQIAFQIQGQTATITLSSGTYGNMTNLTSEINRQLANSSNAYLNSVQASYDSASGRLVFTSTPPPGTPDGTWYIDLPWSSYHSTTGQYAWKQILGTQTTPVEPISVQTSRAALTTYDPIPEQTVLDDSNNTLNLNLGTQSVTVSIAKGTYNTRDALKTALQQALDSAGLGNKATAAITGDGKLQLTCDANSITASGGFYQNVILSKRTENAPRDYVPTGSYSDADYDSSYIIGRKDLTAEPIEIFSGANDIFTFDFAHISQTTASNSYEKKDLSVTIPEGTYNGNELATLLQDKIQEKFDAEGLDDFEIKVSVGGLSTGVVGANDDTALQIVVNRKKDKAPDKGQYILDGIRGSAASFIFYKTTGTPTATYISGTKNITHGITFRPGQNILTLSADSVPYKYTFPENIDYTADEFIQLLNDMFTNGDDNGNTAPLTASIENGTLKISHKVVGSHTISDIGGSARAAVFLEETQGQARNPLVLLVGSETMDVLSIPRVRINSCSLGINSITISRPKYAEKALDRIKHAIELVSSRRSLYGSMQNRLEHTINNNNNVIENTQASESLIRDTNIAEEIMEHSINNILQQASQAMLTQANQMPRLILSLLR